jgi:general secretion pathway protein I
MRRGFTLLEVMISLAILAVALVAISDLNGGAVQMHAYSRRATEATLLLRGKMLDLEEQLNKDGFSDFTDEKHGDFGEEGSPNYAWVAEIIKPDIQLDPSQLLALIGGQAPGGSSAGGTGGTGGSYGTSGGGIAAAAGALAQQLGGAQNALSGLQTGGAQSMLSGPLGGMLSSQMTTFIETLKKSVREVRLTVSWVDGKEKKEISASQIIVILPEMVGKAGQTTTAQQPTQPTTNQPGQPQLPRPPSADTGTQQ